MSSKDLIKVTSELIGLQLRVVNTKDYKWENAYGTAVKVDNYSNKVKEITVNLREIRNAGKTSILKRLGVKSVYLKVLLHEIAHVKQIRKFKGEVFILEYHKKVQYYEDMADRYAKLNYKKVLLALDKRYKMCYI